MENIRSPGNQYITVTNDGLNQLMLVLKNISIKKSEISVSHVDFKKMIPLDGKQLSFL